MRSPIGTPTPHRAPRVTRRTLLGGLAAMSIPIGPTAVWSAEPLLPAQSARVAERAQGFMSKYDVPGMSLAFGRHGEILHSAGYGFADKDRSVEASPQTLFRIASLSKPITATAIFMLIEQGHLSVEDKVFGPGGLLTERFGEGPEGRLHEVTLDHLLTHTAGGWSNASNDPMFQFGHLSIDELIASVIEKRGLFYAPGTHYSYSNFGYALLGRVIEQVTGAPYAEFINSAVMPTGSALTIAGNKEADRLEGESYYFGQASDDDPYEFNIARMDAHGGWLGTAEDLVRFLFRVDGVSPPDDVLSSEGCAQMLTTGPAGGNYARGWAVNSAGNAWHNGSLPGTTATMVMTADGYCWTVLANSRRPNSDINLAQDQLMWDILNIIQAG